MPPAIGEGYLFSRTGLHLRVSDGTIVHMGGAHWRAIVEREGLLLAADGHTDDKKERTASRIANIKHEVRRGLQSCLFRVLEPMEEDTHSNMCSVKVEARRQELEALAADQGEAERKCHLQSDDPESYSADLTRIFAAKVNHMTRIAELTAMREAVVTVTTVEHSKSVRLPVGVLVDLSGVEPGVSMLWSPPSQSLKITCFGVRAVVEQSRTETAAEERVSLSEVVPIEGVFLRQWGLIGSGEGEFRRPTAICVSGDGEAVFVGDLGNNRIQVFERDGSFVRQWGSHGTGQGQFDYVADVAVGAGEVFVCDFTAHRVHVFGVDGSFARQWGREGNGQGDFNGPRGVTVSNGEVLVSDYNARIQVFGVDGTFLRQWGTRGSGEGQLHRPAGLAVSGGEVFVCDEWNDRVVVFGLDGSFVRQWGTRGSGEGQLKRPLGMAVNGDEVIVTCFGNDRVQVFRLDGSFVRQWDGAAGGGDGGIAVSGGEVFLATKHRVQVFQ